MLKDYVEKSFLKYINNDGVPCSDSSETKIYALYLSLLKSKKVVDILFIQRTILLKLILYRAMLPTNTSIIKGYLRFLFLFLDAKHSSRPLFVHCQFVFCVY